MMRGTPYNVTRPSDYVVTGDHVTNWKLNISTSTWPMVAIVSEVVTYDEENSPEMARDALTT